MSLHSSSERFSRAEVSQAVSRQLHLPPELDAIANLSGKLHYFVNQMQSFRTASLDGADFKTLIMSNITPELAKLLDPAQRDAARREQAEKANITSAQAAVWAGGHWLNGQWIAAGASSRGGDGGLTGGNGGRYAGMKDIGIASGVSPAVMSDYTRQYRGMGFGKDIISTFAEVRLNKHDFHELEQRGLKRHEIAAAARDTKAMGLRGKDDVEHAHYMVPPVKDHLKRAHKAHEHGDTDTEKHEVEGAERANAKVTDPKKKKHGDEGIKSYRKLHGLMPSASTPGSEAQKEATAKTIYQKGQAKIQPGKSPEF
jgi:hypothetical protein